MLLLAASAWAGDNVKHYTLDPVHTRVMFTVEHAGYSNAIGTVSGSTGSLRFDPDDWSSAQLQVRVPMQRVDMGDEKWNRATQARNLLDTEAFPEATFISTAIEPIDPQHASVTGMLTLHGISREIVMQVKLNALKRYPLPPFRRTVGFSASTTISRADFGIDAWSSLIGDRVDLRIEAEAQASRGPAGAAEDSMGAPAKADAAGGDEAAADDTGHDTETVP
ncbi:hypothetical protein ABB29_08085 [Pseudoxanthomonas dokdonensis]|uniref:Lipid/polyisoprenoid-binding YceI-like domain-containing protein n=1 Tax=Pseudoxanthomonas dokdonensis TaxID=344882 RepID=A0A0R0CV37_9GAMM|nr:hypothetical protein ABB29_08085 [Pseudoxanthomonas dokdonensis]